MVPKYHLFLKERALPFQLLLLLPLPSVASTSKKLNAGEFAGRDTKKNRHDRPRLGDVQYFIKLHCATGGYLQRSNLV